MPSPKILEQPVTYKFPLAAQQGLRDATGDFSLTIGSADTGIAVLPGERVEIFATGSARIQPGGQLSEAEGAPACRMPSMPEPALPCYSVIYSIGIAGRADEVGRHTGFNPATAGNLFLGMNAPNLAGKAGSFNITVLIIPGGTFTGIWSAPDNTFLVQGTRMTLAAYVFVQNAELDNLQFTLAIAGQKPVSICTAARSAGDIYSCAWDFTLNGIHLHNGPVTIGFTLNGSWHGSSLKALENPDGLRVGTFRYALFQSSSNYAGYAATAFDKLPAYQKVSGRWIVPQANCSAGESSDAGIWVGMTSNASEKSTLAQLGMESGCASGTPRYFMWWEMYPAPAVPLKQSMKPGDSVTATVMFRQGQFRLSIDDHTEKFHFSIARAGKVADTSIAECITEAPTIIDDPFTNTGHVAQLTNFGTVRISCQLNNNRPIADGPQDVVFQMNTSAGVAKASASLLDQAGSTFTVQWRHG